MQQRKHIFSLLQNNRTDRRHRIDTEPKKRRGTISTVFNVDGKHMLKRYFDLPGGRTTSGEVVLSRKDVGSGYAGGYCISRQKGAVWTIPLVIIATVYGFKRNRRTGTGTVNGVGTVNCATGGVLIV